MRQTAIAVFYNNTLVRTAGELPTLRYTGGSLEVRVDGQFYTVGYASGDGYNCLIDTLRQKLNIISDTKRVGQELELKYQYELVKAGYKTVRRVAALEDTSAGARSAIKRSSSRLVRRRKGFPLAGET